MLACYAEVIILYEYIYYICTYEVLYKSNTSLRSVTAHIKYYLVSVSY